MDAFALAVVLALDAAAVAAARATTGLRPREVITLALVFGAMQGAMAALGWAAGAAAARWIASWDHWLAFGVLGALGVRMIVVALRGGEADLPAPRLSARLVIALGLATSLDALAAGITLPLLSVPPGVAIALIAAVTCGLVVLAARGGAALGARLGRKLEIAGGLALCAIGAKILLDHLS